MLAAQRSHFVSVQVRYVPNSPSIKFYVNLEKVYLQKPDFSIVALYNSLAGLFSNIKHLLLKALYQR